MTGIEIEEALAIVDKILQPDRLNTIQETVLRECWLGKTYQEIATEFGYDADYIRVVGSRLWQMLSNAFDLKVTKNNFKVIFRQQARDIQGLQSAADELPDGQISLNSAFYVERLGNESLVYQEILKPGALIRIKAPLNMGKTSFMARIVAHAQTQGYQTVRLNLQLAEASVLSDLDKFLRWLAANIALQLNLRAELDEYWDEDLGSKVSCTTYLQGYILEKLSEPLVLALDEVNRLFEFPDIAQEFLPLLRFWHEEGNNLDLWQKLRLIVVHSTDIYIPLNINQSPFNVGLAIDLPELDAAQMRDLARRYQLDWIDKPGYLESLRALIGGHPYLARLAFYALSTQNITLDKLLIEAATQTGIYSNYLLGHLNTLKENPELGDAFKKVILADCPIRLSTLPAYKLESIGLIDFVGDKVVPSCELYRLYFQERLDQF